MLFVKKYYLLFIIGIFILSYIYTTPNENSKDNKKMQKKIQSEEEWEECLTPEEYKILREKGTEMAFTGKFYKHKQDGVYICSACGEDLFSSDTKYDSGTGWPSFWKPISADKIREELDQTLPFSRTEIVCNNCGGHLGHVFNDGPNPTGLRYCVNSISLDFDSKKNK